MKFRAVYGEGLPPRSIRDRLVSTVLTLVFFVTTVLHTFPAKAQEVSNINAQVELFTAIMEAKRQMCNVAFKDNFNPTFVSYGNFELDFWNKWQRKLGQMEDFLKELGTNQQNPEWEMNELDHLKFECIQTAWLDLQIDITKQASQNEACFPVPQNDTITFQKDYRECEPVYTKTLNILERVVNHTIQRFASRGNDLIMRDYRNKQDQISDDQLMDNFNAFASLTGGMFTIFNGLAQQIRGLKGLYFNPRGLQTLFEQTKESTNDYDSASPYYAMSFQQMYELQQASLNKMASVTSVPFLKIKEESEPEPWFSFDFLKPNLSAQVY